MIKTNRELFVLLKSPTEPKNPLILRDVILSNAPANVSHRGIELLTDSVSTFLCAFEEKLERLWLQDGVF